MLRDTQTVLNGLAIEVHSLVALLSFARHAGPAGQVFMWNYGVCDVEFYPCHPRTQPVSPWG